MRNLILSIAIALASIDFSAHAMLMGDKGGNGGGSWVCREQDGSIRWIKLVDLFEAENEFGRTINHYTGDFKAVTDQVLMRLFRIDPKLFDEVSAFVSSRNYLAHDPPRVLHTLAKLEYIDDSLFRIRPDISECQAGKLLLDQQTGQWVIPYEQIVNFEDGGNILVQKSLYESPLFSALDKAALNLHEPIYAYRRREFGDKDSTITRRIVGILFSTLTDAEAREQIGKLKGTADGTNFVGMKFVKLKGGHYRYRGDGSLPPTDVELSPFEMQATPVTQKQWYDITGLLTASTRKREQCPNSYVEVNAGGLCSDLPIESFTWGMLLTFIDKMNAKRDGYSYRLPTDAEWEYAATAGGEKEFPFGSDWNPSDYIWSMETSKGVAQPVAKKQPNPWGLYDMFGNVFNFVADNRTDVYPQGRDPRVFEPGRALKVARGCGYYSYLKWCRENNRLALADLGNKGDTVYGFRLVRIKK